MPNRIAFRCENPPIFDDVIVSPTFTNLTYFEFESRIFYKCNFDKTLDPLNWENNITISCVGNQTWGVVDYSGTSTPWLPSSCVCKESSQINMGISRAY